MKIKQCIAFAIILLSSVGLWSCAKDDTPNSASDLVISKPEGLSIDRCRTLKLAVSCNNMIIKSLEWSIGDSILSSDANLYFISLKAGTYKIKVKAKNDLKTLSDSVTVTVKQEATAYTPYLTKVCDFMPAPGQFGNVLPQYEAGDTQETINKKVENAIANNKRGMISLGAYGGYVVVGFDHTIVNVPGKKDFKVLGNAFYASGNTTGKKAGSCEPGIVMVAYDKNKNGKPDDDEWYELAGSEYSKPTTIKNYEITYYKPDENKTPTPSPSVSATDTTYVKWTDNQGKSGYIFKNGFHKQSYYPQWAGSKITFKGGTLIANNAFDQSGKGTYWVLFAEDWGYADNAPNDSDLSNFDIDWAVDSNGNKVKLPGIDFVKVYTGLQQWAGWLGETSTEVAGVTDLNL